MSVLFVYRSHYEGPTGKYVRRFEDASILDWFRARWRGASEEAAEQAAHTALGADVYGFDSLFNAIEEHDLKPPRSDSELRDYLDEHLWVEGEIVHTPHAIQVATDDDEIELAYYFFDDAFLVKDGAKAAFLLHESVELPATAGASGYKPRGESTPLGSKGGEGAVYMTFLAYDSLRGGYRIEGLRLPELRNYLIAAEPTPLWPFELRLLRSRIDADRSLAEGLIACAGYPVADICNSIDTSTIGFGPPDAAASELNGLLTQTWWTGSTQDPGKSLLQSETHVAQLCLHTNRWGDEDLYHRWILFDDLWAGAHSDLAEAILRYATRWDVLS
jgi:hypothetical protein